MQKVVVHLFEQNLEFCQTETHNFILCQSLEIYLLFRFFLSYCYSLQPIDKVLRGGLLELIFVSFNPFPNDKILDKSKSKAFTDDNFLFDKNGRKFSKQVENIVGKGEIARYEQFLLFPQCFQKSCTANT